MGSRKPYGITVDLLWGQKLYQKLRFVLVEMNGIQIILASTTLELEPSFIIRLYSYRFRILYELCFYTELFSGMNAFLRYLCIRKFV